MFEAKQPDECGQRRLSLVAFIGRHHRTGYTCPFPQLRLAQVRLQPREGVCAHPGGVATATARPVAKRTPAAPLGMECRTSRRDNLPRTCPTSAVPFLAALSR